MNKYLKTYIRNRNIALKSGNNVKVFMYEFDYLDKEVVPIEALIKYNQPSDIRKIYEKKPSKFLEFLSRLESKPITDDIKKIAQILYIVLEDDALFNNLKYTGLIKLSNGCAENTYLFGKLLEKITTSEYMNTYNMRFFSHILGIMENEISDNRLNDDYIPPKIYKTFFEKYLSIHSINEPEMLVRRINRMHEYLN
jgi:hypothetical protein